jgi:acyl-[acyl-carrier-protein]-phospholipid O-acyltransferase / long-chain-fatty-acid--[acyl-carrier-protein] ligase
VTQKKDATRAEFQTYARTHGASDLMVPAEVLAVDKVPVLGSGKLDYVGVAVLVKEHVAKTAVAAE